MGVFDKSNLDLHDAIPNYDKDDGIDLVKCDKEWCNFKDLETGCCFFETCVIEKYYPWYSKYHNSLTHKCKACGKTYTVYSDEENRPPYVNKIEYDLCPECIQKISKGQEIEGDSTDYGTIATIRESEDLTKISLIEGVGKFYPSYQDKKGEIFNDYSKNQASGYASHAEGRETVALKHACHAEGASTRAEGEQSHAEGEFTVASGDDSHAEGSYTKAYGKFSHSEGSGTVASGDKSHAEGSSTTASGGNSHAEGSGTIASGYYSHAEGNGTRAEGEQSHAEGEFTVASGDDSHAEGSYTKAYGKFSHSEGSGTVASGDKSHAEGINTTASGDESHAEGNNTTASGWISHAEGLDTVASGTCSHAEGWKTKAINNESHAEGYNTTASGVWSHAEGSSTTASGTISHAEGSNTTASGECSHAEGNNTTASGECSHAEGVSTTASGRYSHAEGYNTTASGRYSHAEGYNTTAYSYYSHAEGYNTTASGVYSHAEGEDNTIGREKIYNEETKEYEYKYYNVLASHVEGYNNILLGNNSHVEGSSNYEVGGENHVEGNTNKVSSNKCHIEGTANSVQGSSLCHVEGSWNSVQESTLCNVRGTYNICSPGTALQTVLGKWNIPYQDSVLIIGDGTGDGDKRHNLLRLGWNAHLYVGDKDIDLTNIEGGNTTIIIEGGLMLGTHTDTLVDRTVFSTEETSILKITFHSLEVCNPAFIASVQLNMDRDGVVVVEFYINSSKDPGRTLRYYYSKGDHCMTIFDWLNAGENQVITVEVRMYTEYYESDQRKQEATIQDQTNQIEALKKALSTGSGYIEPGKTAIDTTPPTVKIEPYKAKGMVFSQGISTEHIWDGLINIYEGVDNIIIEHRDMAVNSISVLSADVEVSDPYTPTASDTFDQLTIAKRNFTYSGFYDHVLFGEIVKSMTLNTLPKYQGQYNATYVYITSNNNYALVHEYVSKAEYNTNIDEGYMMELDINTSGFETLENVVIESE